MPAAMATALFDKSRDLNTATPGPGFNPASRRPYPQLQAISAAISRGWMDYNSLQVRLERRAAKGLFLLGSYTYAKALTNGVSGFGGDPGIVYYPVVTLDRRRQSFGEHRSAAQLHDQLALPCCLRQRGGLPVRHERRSQAILGGWQINGIFVATAGIHSA